MPTSPKKNRPLKIFGGTCVYRGKSCRIIVSASSSTRAVAILNDAGLNISLHHFRGYFSITQNVMENDIAKGHPNRGLFKRDNGSFSPFPTKQTTGKFTAGQKVYWKCDDQGDSVLTGVIDSIIPAGMNPDNDVYRTGNRTPFWEESYVIRVEMTTTTSEVGAAQSITKLFWPTTNMLSPCETVS